MCENYLFISQKLKLSTDQQSFNDCIEKHKSSIEEGSMRESDCLNHVTTMAQLKDENDNKPTNKIIACSSHAAKPKILSFEVIFFSIVTNNLKV